MLRPLLNIESLLSSAKDPSGPGRSSGCSGFPPFFDLVPQSFWCHLANLPDDECRCNDSVFKQAGSLSRAVLRFDLGSRWVVLALGQRKSRFKNPASMVAPPLATVDKPRVADLDAALLIFDRGGGPLGATWSNVKPGLGFALKKQMLSDCNLRNLRRASEGTRLCKVGRIAVTRDLVIVSL